MTGPRVIEVDDPADERLAAYVGVRDRIRRAETAGSFLCEGILLVERLLDSDLEVRSLLVAPGKLDRLRPRLEGRAIDVLVAPQEVMNETVGFNIHRGVIASARRRPSPAAADLLVRVSSVAVLEGITDHENLGAVFRSALALGIGGILLDTTSGDPYYRRAVRVSMGAVFSMPFSRLGAADDLIDVLDGAGYASIALTPDPAAIPIDKCRPPEGRRVAVLLGAEGDGLRPATMEGATYRVRIPIRRGVDSLNVGHAAAIAFQRFGSV
ncbi:MAG TPA: RNA methyltransferase [Acidimicrobiia bacterium]|nr:RNA methyltransferase [Acidimicrobiia bacterium]